jgi:hypothetical protein
MHVALLKLKLKKFLPHEGKKHLGSIVKKPDAILITPKIIFEIS